MTYSEHSQDAPFAGDAPRGTTPRQAAWSLIIAAGLVAVLGLTFYGINAKWEGQTAAKPPAVPMPAPASPRS